METLYTIVGERFKRVMLNDLENARYIAEDEDRQNQYLGTELRGHIYQNYLPGQFLTFNGKYYEMVSVTPDGQVQVRRAADHITGRPSYRQVREYVMSSAEDCPEMGACRDIGGIRITRQYADFCVKTPAYWQMGSYNDFAGGKKVTLNGIPDREYYHKQVLRLDFPTAQEGFPDEIRYTLTVLFNEVFRTLFAENQNYIVAVTAGEPFVPLTYGLRGTCESDGPDKNAIYLIEDSQLDIGLLVAVERNLYRIFSIVCDYLDWHLETLEKSQNPPPKPVPPDYKAPPEPEEEETAEPEKKGLLSFLRGLFGRKGKKEKTKQDWNEKHEAEEDSAPEKPDTVRSEPEESETEESEPEKSEPEKKTVRPANPSGRAPYHDRYYLLYGGTEVPKQMDLKGTLEFLKGYGFDNGALKQAREGKNVAELVEKNFTPNKPGAHYCDFCGMELTGTEYDVLADGRERCTNCSRTAVRTVEEFEQIYQEVKQNLESFFGAKITVPVKVQMVNAKKLHRRLGKTFTPTSQSDGRVVGVAIKSGRNDYALLLENGSPRLASAMTIAHELTHIWQYVNWDAAAIQQMYGPRHELEVYEGMAKWTEIQYAYLIGEPETARREEMSVRARPDAYGTGFCKYASRYPLSVKTHLDGSTPFEDVKAPL